MKLRSLQVLCLLNFFIADVRDGLGPFLGIFLVSHHWQADDIGLVMTAGSLAGLLATFPSGMIVDATRHKRLLIIVSSLLITFSTQMLWYFPTPTIVIASQIVTGLAAAVVAPAIAGITLGIGGQKIFVQQMGRNEAFNHAGNMTIALLAAFTCWIWGTGSVFLLMTAMAVCTLICTSAINKDDIDHNVARGSNEQAGATVSPSLLALLKRPELLVTGSTLLLFHLANAAQLPMLSMQIASSSAKAMFTPGTYAALTVAISQVVMIPAALLTARYATRCGYARLILIALVVLPLRAAIASFWGNEWVLFPVQVLDGVAAGILGVAVPGLIAWLFNGSGHINAALGLVMLFQGLGASLSPALAGAIVSDSTYSHAYMALGGIALCALLLWLIFSKRVFHRADRMHF
ncbi:MFS transporter [Erwinia aphidicola]|uniref:MFS transporter n=1 Tax=Erwinia aphidicola TaxID=68334 RepID=UPI0030163A4A